MRFNREELESIKTMAEMFMVNVDDPKQSARLHNIVAKCEACLDFKLRSKISPEVKKKCDYYIREGDRVSKEYNRYSGDMGLINEFDALKKLVAVMADSIGDLEGRLRADSEIAKRELETILDRIKEDLLAKEEAKSVTEAERKAKNDMRYLSAVEDYRELLVYASIIKNKYRNFVDLRDDIRQSISTARNSIIAEGYNK